MFSFDNKTLLLLPLRLLNVWQPDRVTCVCRGEGVGCWGWEPGSGNASSPLIMLQKSERALAVSWLTDVPYKY